MDGPKYCVYNQTRESFLSLSVTVADSAANLRRSIEDLTLTADSGLWIRPFRGLPPAHWVSPIDVVYLDSDYHVIRGIESFPTSTAEPHIDNAVSALALPVHTIYSSQTQPGDQLVICVADEIERRLARLSTSFTASSSFSSAQGVVSSGEKQPDSGSTRPHAPVIRNSGEETVFQGSEAMHSLAPKTIRPNPLKSWLQSWLSSDRRRAHRQAMPGLVAYYWTGSAPRAYQVADISSSGFYLMTEERWFPGTMVLMTLQRTDSSGNNLDDSIAVQSRVVRWGNDGLGLAFVVARSIDGAEYSRENGADRKTLERFLARLKESSAELRVVGR